MNVEQSSITKDEHKREQNTVVPERFPVVNDEHTYYFDDKPELQEGKIVHFVKKTLGSEKEKKHCFSLLSTIGGLHYHFYLAEGYGDDMYIMSFKTEEYEYATINLDKPSKDILIKTISAFLESVSEYSDNIKEIRVQPAPASYSAEEIEECIDAVLSSPDNRLSRKRLLAEHNGFRIFDWYHELFGKDFLPVHYNKTSRSRGRSRLFKMMAKKYLPNWEITQEPGFSLDSDFRLTRKNNHQTDAPNNEAD